MGEVLLQMNHRKTFRFIFVLLVGLGLGFFSSNTAVASQPNTPWSLIGFTSIYTPDRLKDIFTNRHSYQDSYLVALALNHRFARPNRSLGWEWEVQGVRHFGRQNHFETNALILARWYRFPWNDWVATPSRWEKGSPTHSASRVSSEKITMTLRSFSTICCLN
jgi:hypothetical protein